MASGQRGQHGQYGQWSVCSVASSGHGHWPYREPHWPWTLFTGHGQSKLAMATMLKFDMSKNTGHAFFRRKTIQNFKKFALFLF